MKRNIKLTGESLRDFNLNINKEYFITNGMGSFSSGCPNGNYSRQYHGLFVRSYYPPINRYIALYKIEEIFQNENLGVQKVLVANREKIYRGDKFLYEFTQNPFPKFRYKVNNNFLTKEIIMGNMRDLVGVRYETNTTDEFSIEIFMNFRDAHHLNEIPIEDYVITKEDNHYSILLGDEKLFIYTSGEIEIVNKSEEVENFYGDIENEVVRKKIIYDLAINERGETSLDTCTKVLRVKFSGQTSYDLIASFEKLSSFETLEDIREKEIKRLEELISNSKLDYDKETDNFYDNLIIASDSFISYKKSTGGKTVIAGYPWFNDWGRDTMISFTGLVLSTRRFEDARSILKTFKKYCNRGMLPNNFPDAEEEQPMYNTIDGTLWYFYGIYKYLEYTDDYKFIKEEIYSVLKDIIEWHIKGTRYNIKVDENDGLLSGGDEHTQLTWMDVKYKGYAVTPRWGKTVEINILWYNALKIFEMISNKIGEKFIYTEYIDKFEKNFKKSFLNDEGYLNDYITPTCVNKQIRPNQIFAVSMPFSILNKEEAKKIVDIVRKELLTPYGLRTLSKKDKDYIGVYEGNLCSRDLAYHQGTTWPWLIGHFIEAYHLCYGKDNLREFLVELENHFFNDSGLGNISEIFDGDEPMKARGCFAQAWSVGEILRIYKEIIL